MDLETRNKFITIALGIIIILLSYYLYRSIVDPYQEVLDEREMTERVRHRMSIVRDAMIQYRNIKGQFPPSEGGLDTLVAFLKTNEVMVERGAQLFEERWPSVYNPDSLLFSPRPPHNRFMYESNDTLRPPIYLLEDPDSGDKIGSLRTTTMLNAPNWN